MAPTGQVIYQMLFIYLITQQVCIRCLSGTEVLQVKEMGSKARIKS